MSERPDDDRDRSAASASGRGRPAERDAEPPGSGRRGDHEVARPPMPRWVRWSGVVALVFVILLILLRVVGGGQHGPARHTSAGTAPEQASAQVAPPPAGVTGSASGIRAAGRAARTAGDGRR